MNLAAAFNCVDPLCSPFRISAGYVFVRNATRFCVHVILEASSSDEMTSPSPAALARALSTSTEEMILLGAISHIELGSDIAY